jgi:hypothetical protein
MSNIPKPSNAEAEELVLKRTVANARHREQQPAYNQPRQDTLPGASSGDS